MLPVLMYHAISDLPEGPLRSLAVPPRRLAEQFGALREAGYRLVGLTEALELTAAGSREPVVALTFDDGYQDFLRHGVPLLADLNATATLYPAVGHLGRTADWLGAWADAFGPLLNSAQVCEVAQTGVEIGSHSLLHHPLDVLPAAQLEREITEGRDQLAQLLQRPIKSFCYPHGYTSARVRSAVARAGHENACTIGRRVSQPSDDPLAVTRLQPTPDHSGADLLRLVRTGGSPLVPALKRAAAPGWRLARWSTRRLTGRELT